MAKVRTVSAAEIETRVFGTDGPVVLEFYQATCPPCRVLEPRLARVASDFEDRVAVYRVDVDRDLLVAQQEGASRSDLAASRLTGVPGLGALLTFQ